MTKSCPNCNQIFEITDEDLSFYDEISPIIAGKKISIPAPQMCPDCRQQRRLNFRNERNLYYRDCNFSREKIISVYSKDKPFPVYDVDAWYSDSWDPLDYGQDYDFGCSFFEQFKQLLYRVPQLARSVVRNQNSDYINQAGMCKNCYLVFEADYNQDCYYSSHITDSVSICDCLYCDRLELCYQCVNCQKSYNLKYALNCVNCSDSIFLKDCIGCSNCIMCVNLRNKKYCIYNKQYSHEEYEEKKKDFNLNSNKHTQLLQKYFEDFSSSFPEKYMQGVSNQDCTGNCISNSKNCHFCFDVLSSEDSKYLTDCRNTKKSYDITVFGSQKGINFSLDCHEIGDGVTSIYFSDQVWAGCSDLFYSKCCVNNSSNLFGCVGLKQKHYCILNKQYTKEDYLEFVPRIIQHMKQNEEFGGFFPKELSQFGYNETLAIEYYSLTKEEAQTKEYKWSEAENLTTIHDEINQEIPDDIVDIDESICGRILKCEASNKPFKIVPQEFSFYKRMGLTIPRKDHNQRHYERMRKKAKRMIFDSVCSKCAKKIKTSLEGNNVYCSECFEKDVY